MTRFECIDATSFWPMVLFLSGLILLTFLIAKRNGFGIRQALLAMIGRRKFKRSALIAALHVAILLVPLGLWMWLLGRCDPTLF